MHCPHETTHMYHSGEREISKILQKWVEDAPKTLAKIRAPKIALQGLSTHIWRRGAPPEMGGAPLLRYFLGAYFCKGFGGVFHPFLEISFISRSPLYHQVSSHVSRPVCPLVAVHLSDIWSDITGSMPLHDNGR